MNFLSAEVHKFDWDNISVGNTQLDHSQNFFSKQHYEHERIDEMDFLQQKMVETELNDLVEEKENILKSPSSVEGQENEKTSNTLCSNVFLKVEEKEYPKPLADVANSLEVGQKGNHKVTANLACQWSTQKSKKVASKGAISKNMPPPPHAYLVKDIYQRKREEAERRRAEEERKQREFRSRPAPTFNHLPVLQKRKPVHAVTMPVTPQVLKNTRETEEKRRKKLEEWKRQNHPPKFEHRSPTVLKEKPFVPEKKPFFVQQCPFNLHTEKRLQERKHYDELKQKSLEEKKKQVEIKEEERERVEKERIRELRKAATFKARPNPFKN